MFHADRESGGFQFSVAEDANSLDKRFTCSGVSLALGLFSTSKAFFRKKFQNGIVPHIELPRCLAQPYQFFFCHTQICLFFKDFKTLVHCGQNLTTRRYHFR
jgi:hypothetical protein